MRIFSLGCLAVPEFLDLGNIHTAQIGQRLFRQPRRNADPQAAGEKFQQRPAAIGVQRIQPAFQQLRHLAARRTAQRFDHLG